MGEGEGGAALGVSEKFIGAWRRSLSLEIQQIGFSDLTINKRCSCDAGSVAPRPHPADCSPSVLCFTLERRMDELSNSIGRLGGGGAVFSQFLTMSESFRADFRAAEFDFNHSSRRPRKTIPFLPHRSLKIHRDAVHIYRARARVYFREHVGRQ